MNTSRKRGARTAGASRNATAAKQVAAAHPTDDSVGVASYDPFTDAPPGGATRKPRVVARYTYCNEAGEVLYRVQRWEPGFRGGRKSFTQQRWDTTAGKWVSNMQGVSPVLYRLPEVIAAVHRGDAVYVVEGEKDADALVAAGVVATCNPMGAGKWRARYNESLRDANVIVWTDKDETGRKHVADVSAHLRGVAKTCLVVESRTGKDAADHLADGHAPHDFMLVEPSTLPATRHVTTATATAAFEVRPGSWTAEKCAQWALARLHHDVPAGSLHNGRRAVALALAQQLRDVPDDIAEQAMRLFATQVGQVDSEGNPNAFPESEALITLHSARTNVPEDWTPGVFAYSPGSPTSSPTWPVLDEDALCGLAGKVVRTLDPHTESDRVGLLLDFLVSFGSAVGSSPHAIADSAPHPARLNALLVGDTSRSRKGTSRANIKRLFLYADTLWSAERVMSGLASGEGLIAAVADPTYKDGELVGGTDDKRLLVAEPEFARVLAAASRDQNTLSTIIRHAWDEGSLRVMTRNQPLVATGAHVSILGHITIEELKRRLTDTDIANGFANRFLFACVKRSKILPHGGNLTSSDFKTLGREVAEAVTTARKSGVLRRSDDADKLWERLYAEVAEATHTGLVDALTARAEAQMLRLSVAYALLDGSNIVEVPHLEAAHAVWRYCESSVGYIFAGRTGDPVADRIDTALRHAADGLSRTDIGRLFSGHVKSKQIDVAIAYLIDRGLAVEDSVPTGGRDKTVVRSA